MALVELTTDLTRVADALERIAFLLDRLVYPPLAADVKEVHQATLDDLHVVTPEDLERINEEQVAFAQRYRVVPGSEAMALALKAWEDEQRSVYGETWQPPEDWRTVFAAAGRGQSGGDRGAASGAAPEAADGSRR